MTTPEQKAAEKRVIDAARDLSISVHNKCSVTELHLKTAAVVDAYDALNALSTSVESLPEKVDEWDGWDALECKWGCCQIVQFGQSKFLRATRCGGGWTEWATTEMSTDASHVNGWTKSPARLEVLQSLPDELVKAAKGVGNV